MNGERATHGDHRHTKSSTLLFSNQKIRNENHRWLETKIYSNRKLGALPVLPTDAAIFNLFVLSRSLRVLLGPQHKYLRASIHTRAVYVTLLFRSQSNSATTCVCATFACEAICKCSCVFVYKRVAHASDVGVLCVSQFSSVMWLCRRSVSENVVTFHGKVSRLRYGPSACVCVCAFVARSLYVGVRMAHDIPYAKLYEFRTLNCTLASSLAKNIPIAWMV